MQNQWYTTQATSTDGYMLLPVSKAVHLRTLVAGEHGQEDAVVSCPAWGSLVNSWLALHKQNAGPSGPLVWSSMALLMFLWVKVLPMPSTVLGNMVIRVCTFEWEKAMKSNVTHNRTHVNHKGSTMNVWSACCYGWVSKGLFVWMRHMAIRLTTSYIDIPFLLSQ